jgi:hypothetical protein
MYQSVPQQNVESSGILMKRRTFRQLRAKTQAAQHHNVYVVLLDPAVKKLRKVRAVNPQAPGVNAASGARLCV